MVAVVLAAVGVEAVGLQMSVSEYVSTFHPPRRCQQLVKNAAETHAGSAGRVKVTANVTAVGRRADVHQSEQIMVL